MQGASLKPFHVPAGLHQTDFMLMLTYLLLTHRTAITVSAHHIGDDFSSELNCQASQLLCLEADAPPLPHQHCHSSVNKVREPSYVASSVWAARSYLACRSMQSYAIAHGSPGRGVQLPLPYNVVETSIGASEWHAPICMLMSEISGACSGRSAPTWAAACLHGSKWCQPMAALGC